ncbi:hypothetical protein MHYP_G00327040 [Metynnis hypsauchen]
MVEQEGVHSQPGHSCPCSRTERWHFIDSQENARGDQRPAICIESRLQDSSRYQNVNSLTFISYRSTKNLYQ